MTIDNDGTISDTITDSLEFDTLDSIWYAPVIPVSGDHFLIIYEGTTSYGMSLIVEIDTTGDISVFTYEWDSNIVNFLDAIRLGRSEYYLIAYQESGDGYALRAGNDGAIQGAVDS
jgi:hypothetical protein